MEYTRRPISILLEDELATELFSQLLQAVGEETVVIREVSELDADSRVVTEPRFFPELSPSLHERCLVVGNKEVLRNLPVLSLSRPLTEEKIETALASFLRA